MTKLAKEPREDQRRSARRRRRKKIEEKRSTKIMKNYLVQREKEPIYIQVGILSKRVNALFYIWTFTEGKKIKTELMTRHQLQQIR